MKTFKVKFEEGFEKVVEITARDKEEAYDKAQEMYMRGAVHFEQKDFKQERISVID